MISTIILAMSTVVLTTGALGMPGPGDAGQDSTTTVIGVMQIDVWPEYDKPQVLVIYQGKLETPSSLPVAFKLEIPRNAQVHMAGGIGSGGRHLHAEFTVQPIDDDLAEVSYELTSTSFYMEFYYDPLGEGDQRSFGYPVVSPYPVRQLVVQVQEPARSSDFVVSPAASDVTSDERGLRYYRLGLANVPGDSRMDVQIAYAKSDRDPSVTGSAASAESANGVMRAVAITSVLLILGAVVLGVVLSRRSRRVNSGSQRHPRRQPQRQQQRERVRTGKEVRSKGYCTGCGNRLEEGDVFCGSCGRAANKQADVPAVHR